MTTTGIFLVILFVTAGIYDFIVVCKNGVGCSISRSMQRAGFRSPIVSLVIGALLGHLFLYFPIEITDQDVRAYIEKRVTESSGMPYIVPAEEYDVSFVPKTKTKTPIDRKGINPNGN